MSALLPLPKTRWPEVPLRGLFEFQGGGTPSKENPEFWSGTIPWVSPKDMKSPVVADTQDRITESAVHESATRLVPPSSILMVVRSGILKHTIPTALNRVVVALNQDMKALIALRDLDQRYFRYFIEGHQDRFLSFWRKLGATVESLETERIKATKVPVPPLPTQKAIADFLDRKTAAIDALIAGKKKLLDLLAEKRAALINQAVTKGLDPNVPMKDSGIPWIGEIPAHWEVVLVRLLARLESGHTPSRSKPEYWVADECNIPWFSLADVWQLRSGTRLYLGETKECISEVGMANSAARLLPAGTVVLSRTASVGFTGIMRRPMATTQDFANWICGPRLQPEYLCMSFRAMGPEFKRLKMGSTHQTIYMPDIRQLAIPVPPVHEQRSVARETLRRTKQVDETMRRITTQIQRLQEYRQALITAAVTGQLDIPEEDAAA